METPGVVQQDLVKIERLWSWTQSAISIQHSSIATRLYAGRAYLHLIVIGGQTALVEARSVCPSTSSGHRLIKTSCGGCGR
jgi:hypothetical protein